MKNDIKKSALSWLLVFSLILPLLSSVIYTQAADGDIKDYEAMSMEEIFASDESLTWVITGDSITHNGNWTAGANGYGEWFEQYLYSINRGDDSVVLSGWGGAQTRDFLATSPSKEGTNEDPGMGVKNFITKYNPDVITIKLGMNDRYIPTATFRQHYEQMLTDIYSICADEYGKKPKIILLSPTPLQSENVYDDTYHVNNDDAVEESTLRIRNEVESIAKKYDLLFCDLRTAYMNENKALGEDYAHTFFSDASDGLHPNPAGQYLIFKTLCKTLGRYNETNPIFQLTYDDLNLHAMYTDDTVGVTYTGNYGSVNTADDSAEMDKTMPTIDGANLIASVEFDHESGAIDSTNIDIDVQTDEVLDPLTLDDVKALGKEFTLVFRANLGVPSQKNQPVLSFSSDDLDSAGWSNAFTVGTQGNIIDSDDDEIYYQVKKGNTNYVNSGGTINIGYSTTANDNLWHTIAIVQREESFEYYIDGKKIGFNDTTHVLKESIGTLYKDATSLSAKIGLYSTGNASNYNLKGKFDYWQFYGKALSASDIASYYSESTINWGSAVQENNTWAVAGGAQMAGYEGTVVNRSLMRYIENAMRASSGIASYRDIHMYNLASSDYDVATLVEKYDTLVAEREYDVFMLLAEIPEVYESNYAHSTDLVATYKENIETLLSKNSGKVVVLWTPLASNDAKMNGYIDEYANAVREIAASNSSILFFDANQFMNDNMKKTPSLLNNWFENGQYISQLCSVDVARAFYETIGLSGTGKAELSDHNLRYTSDKNIYKGNYVRDYLQAKATVDGETVSLDVSAITTVYPEAKLKIAILPYKGAGDYNEDIIYLDDVATVSASGNVYTFKAPCADLNLAIYGEQGGLIYRYKDISLTVDTEATIPEANVAPLTDVYLDSLEVMSAPSLNFDEDKTEYTVDLYQYQTYARVRATAKAGITITVNDEVVASNALSDLIKADDGDKITVTASGKVNGETVTKTYTLNLKKPEYPDIIITEVMQDGYMNYTRSGNDNYELIEIYNASGKDLNLLDYSIGYKKDYTYNDVTVSNGGEYPYYFTGNDQAFSGNATHTGIKELTKYSMYWGDEYTEPKEITFKADSTMVIWVKFSPQSTVANRETYGASLTYETLIKALKDHAGTHTLTTDINGTEKAVVPLESQIVIAEASVDSASSGLEYRARYTPSNKNWYLDGFGENSSSNNTPTRGWLFILKEGATVPENGSITEEGNNIISAAKWVRPGSTNKLSSVFSYNTTRGMSLVLNESYINYDLVGTGNTSDVMGYSNLTSFGAVEYWQKPRDFGDTEAPTVTNNTLSQVANGVEGVISLDLADNSDIRYMEVYVRSAGEAGFTKVAVKDFVLETGVMNAGVSADITSTSYSYSVGEVIDTVEYYVTVVDGNNNTTSVGTKEEPLKISLVPKIVEEYTAAKAAEYIGAKVPDCEQKGYLFSGWYADEACATSPIQNKEEASGTVYALFVEEDVLSVKAQISSNLENDDKADDTTGSIRFVTTVDSLYYLQAGFKVSYDKDGAGEGEPISVTRASKEVYKKLYAVNATGGTPKEYEPTEFSSASIYFKACTVVDVPEANYSMDFTVTPFWVTPDGIEVEGVTAVKSINDGIHEDDEAEIDGSYFETLEEAVTVANANADATTIIVLNDAEVESQLSITTNVTIQNPAREDITIYRGSGLAATDMFAVANGATLTIQGVDEKGSLVLDGRTVAEATAGKGRDAAVGSSGSLINNSGTVNLTNVTAQYVKKTGNDGAIVYNASGATVKVKDSLFDNNYTHRHAAAIYNIGTAEVINSEFTNNKSGNNAGVLCINAGTSMKVDSCTFTNNSGAQGGVIWGNRKYEVTNCTFESNSGTAFGGVIINKTSDAVIKNNTFIDNHCDSDGGAIYNEAANITIERNTFTSNDSSSVGGAIYNKGTGVTISENTFTDNESGGNGGAVRNNGASLTMKDNTFTENTSGKQGGAIYSDGGNLALEDNVFTKNTSTTDGGAICTHGAAPIITDCKFVGNTATVSGGALYAGSGRTVTIKAGDNADMAIFEGNTAKGGFGGGAIAFGTGDLIAENYTFKNNTAEATGNSDTPNGGGAIRLNSTNYTNSSITGCVFDSNSTNAFGGAISSISGVTIDNSKFVGNKAANQRGGAIYFHGGKTWTIKAEAGSDKALFQDNTAHQGGAICIGSGTLNVTDYTFDGNYTKGSGHIGGAIKLNDAAITAKLTRCKFLDNVSQKGGAICADSSATSKASPVTLTNCLFSGNKVTDASGYTNKGGGAIYANTGVTINLVGTDSAMSIFQNNTSNYQGGAIYLKGTLTGSGYTFISNTPNNIYLDGGTNNATYTEKEE